MFRLDRFYCILKHNDQIFSKVVILINESRPNFAEKQVYMKLLRQFWKILHAYNEGNDYKEVLMMLFSDLSKDTVISHRRISNTNIND